MKLIITHKSRNSRPEYQLRCSYHEFIDSGKLPKQLGFDYNGVTKQWYTRSAKVALLAVDYADNETAEVVRANADAEANGYVLPDAEKELTYKDGMYILKFDANCAETKDVAKRGFNKLKRVRLAYWTEHPGIAMQYKSVATGRALELLEHWQHNLKQRYEDSWAVTSSIEVPTPEGVSLYDYQRAGVDYILKGDGSGILGDPMGIGKTIQAIGVVNCLPHVSTVLVICPNSVKYNWRRELRIWLANRDHDIEIAGSSYWPETDSLFSQHSSLRVVIVNYEALSERGYGGKILRFPDEMFDGYGKPVLDAHGKPRDHPQAGQARLRAEIADEVFDVVIADEVHRVKNTGAAMTQAFNQIRCQHAIGLTGTLSPNELTEAYNPLHWVRPHVFRSPAEFPYLFQGNKGKLSLDSKRSAAPFSRMVRGTCMVRRPKDVLPLPPLTQQIVRLDPPDGVVEAEQQRLRELGLVEYVANFKRKLQAEIDPANLKDFKAELDKINEVGNKLVDLSMIAEVRRETALAKLPLVCEHVDERVANGGPTVVFAHHREVQAALYEHFGSRAVWFKGGMSPSQINDVVNAYERPAVDSPVQVFVGSLMAAREGLNLVRGCQVDFAEFDWTPGVNYQAMMRVHRAGQKSSVSVNFIVLPGSIDEEIIELLIRKQEILDEAYNVKH